MSKLPFPERVLHQHIAAITREYLETGREDIRSAAESAARSAASAQFNAMVHDAFAQLKRG